MLVKFYKNIFGGFNLKTELFEEDMEISDNLLENSLMQGAFNNKNIEIESNNLNLFECNNLHENTFKHSLPELKIGETDFETVTYALEDTNQFKEHATLEWPDINKRFHKLKHLIYNAQVEELVELARNEIIDKKQFNRAIFLVITTCRVTFYKCGLLDEKCFSNFESCINSYEGPDQFLNFICFMECTILNTMTDIYKSNTFSRVYKKPKNVITNTLFYLKYPSTPYAVVKFKNVAFLFYGLFLTLSDRISTISLFKNPFLLISAFIQLVKPMFWLSLANISVSLRHYGILLKRYENVHVTPHTSLISRIFIKISEFYKNNDFLFTTEDQTNIERVLLKENCYKRVKIIYKSINACNSKYYVRKLEYLNE